MSRALLDVNILLALLTDEHVHTQAARSWFATNAHSGWATCVLTQAGFVRISAQNRELRTTVAQAQETLETACAAPEHQFWALDHPLSEMLPEIRQHLHGHKQHTDAILLDLAIRRGGKLVTLDRHIRKLLSEDSPHQSAIEVIPA